MQTLNELKKQLIADGVLSDSDIARLRTALMDGEDGGMTMEKGNFMFALKDNINENRTTSAFKELFIDSITALLLEDETSPGEIDEDEAKWLRAKIQSKGYQDKFDKALLDNIKSKSINFPEILNYKSKVARNFEGLLFFTRYLSLVAVIGSLLAAVALFIKGGILVCDGLAMFLLNFASPDYESMLEVFVSSVDVFLFAMVLIIFGVGVYELFISKIDPVVKKVDGRPNWMQVHSVDDLKSSLGKVILMVLIVTFFKHSIEVEYGDVNALLKLGVGIVLIALALFITNKAHHK